MRGMCYKILDFSTSTRYLRILKYLDLRMIRILRTISEKYMKTNPGVQDVNQDPKDPGNF